MVRSHGQEVATPGLKARVSFHSSYCTAKPKKQDSDAALTALAFQTILEINKHVGMLK